MPGNAGTRLLARSPPTVVDQYNLRMFDRGWGGSCTTRTALPRNRHLPGETPRAQLYIMFVIGHRPPPASARFTELGVRSTYTSGKKGLGEAPAGVG